MISYNTIKSIIYVHQLTTQLLHLLLTQVLGVAGGQDPIQHHHGIAEDMELLQL